MPNDSAAPVRGIPVRPGLVIPAGEIWFEFSHSSGPGGQNVNKVETTAALCFHVAGSGVLTPGEKAIVASRLAGRMNADGVLRVVCGTERSQGANRRLAAERFAMLLGEALRPVKPRRPTRPTRGAVESRLRQKRLLAAKKTRRRAAEEE